MFLLELRKTIVIFVSTFDQNLRRFRNQGYDNLAALGSGSDLTSLHHIET